MQEPMASRQENRAHQALRFFRLCFHLQIYPCLSAESVVNLASMSPDKTRPHAR